MSVLKMGFIIYSVSYFVQQANTRSYSKYYFAYSLFLISFYYFHGLNGKDQYKNINITIIMVINP